MTIAVAGTGYVGLSIATLLAQHHKVLAVDIVPEKVEMINRRQSPIQDEYIEKYFAEKELDLTATLDAEMAYKEAELVVIAAPVITWIIDVNSAVWFNGYVFSHERLILNALLTFVGMLCLLNSTAKLTK